MYNFFSGGIVMMIKFGVVGSRRGRTFIKHGTETGMELTALCDLNPDGFSDVPQAEGIPVFTDYDEMLKSDIDAVVLANYFHEHTEFATKALKAGKHVMTECQAAVTMAQCVNLVEAVEESGKIFMLAENYPYFAYNQEMRKIYQSGEIGEIQYGEGEYIHPDFTDARVSRSPGFNHWRNRLPATFYCSHSLAPIMYITGTIPLFVNSLVIPKSMKDHQSGEEIYLQDRASVILAKMDNGAVVRLLQPNLRGHGNWYSIRGTLGIMENLRPEGRKDELRIFHDDLDMTNGMEKEKIYTPDFGDLNESAKKAGHGGGDYFTSLHFKNAIEKNKQPFFDVYKAVAIAAVGIQAYRSAIDNGAPYAIPDFKDATECEKYRDDHHSPFAEDGHIHKLPYSIYDYPEVSKKARDNATAIWRDKESGRS